MAIYGQNMVLTWSLELVLPKSLCQGMFHAKVHIAGVYPVGGLQDKPPQWPKYGSLWPTHGPHLVLKIGSS